MTMDLLKVVHGKSTGATTFNYRRFYHLADVCLFFYEVIYFFIFFDMLNISKEKGVMKQTVAFILLLMFLGCAPGQGEKGFEGAWILRDGSGADSFTVTIVEKSGLYYGYYTAVTRDGSRIDALTVEDDPSFTFPVSSGEEILTEFTTGYSGETGTVKLILKGDHLSWNVTRPPAGQYYFPLKAELVRE